MNAIEFLLNSSQKFWEVLSLSYNSFRSYSLIHCIILTELLPKCIGLKKNGRKYLPDHPINLFTNTTKLPVIICRPVSLTQSETSRNSVRSILQTVD